MDDLRMFRELLRTHHAFYNDNPQGLTVELNMDQVVGLYCSLTKVLDECNRNDWIDVNDRLPDDREYHLVQWELNGLINIEWGVYEDNKWIAVRDSLNITSKVVAWKEIKPYKKEK